MENTEKNLPQGVPATLDEIQKEVDKQVGKWLRIPQEEAVMVEFTGKTWLREASFTKNDTTTNERMVDFELVTLLEDGSHQILSRNIKNSDVPKILANLRAGKYKMVLSKDKSNKLSVAAVK